MTDQDAVALDDALARVVEAARRHLAAVQAAAGALDDPEVWDSYVALNNASHAYDALMRATYGESTPWETEPVTGGVSAPGASAPVTDAPDEPAEDPHPAVVSVRQRRDYRVPSVSRLLAAAELARRRRRGDPDRAPESVGHAVLELVRDGDGLLGGIDGPELEPLGGVVTVTEDDALVARVDEWHEADWRGPGAARSG